MNKFLFGGIYDDRYYSYNTPEEMIEKLMTTEKETFITATNLSFDFFGLFTEHKYYRDFKPIMRHSTLLLAKINHKRFIDTFNYIPFSVKKLGNAIGIQKQYSRYSKTATIPKTKTAWQQYRRYNRIDCLITKKFMEYLQDTCNKLGCELKMTIGSTAMDLYRRKYIPCTIYKEKDFEHIRGYLYNAYYGGRTEAFERGRYRQPMYYYDFNSLYPSCMLNRYPYPSSEKYIEDKKGNLSEEYIRKYEGVSEVIITSPKHMNYPLLPERKDNKLIFPTGNIAGYYTHIELRKAIQEGYKILKVYKSIYYTKTFYPFKKYVKTLYTLRKRYKKEGNEAMSICIKLFLNSLYGKFAMKNVQETSIKDFNEEEVEEGYQIDHRNMIGYKTTEKEAENNYVIPIFSIYTTAYGRIKLYEALKNYKAIYCDTDSILTTTKILPSEELGELKLEHEVKEAIIVRPKMYYIKTKDNKEIIRCKGFGHMDKEDFIKLLKGKGIRQIQFIKFKEAMKRQYSINQKVRYKKFAELNDDKRAWSSSFSLQKISYSKPLQV